MAVAIQEHVKTEEATFVPTPPTLRPFTVREYERLHEVGIIGEDERVELVGGEIVEMAAIGFRHANTVNLCNRVLVPKAGENIVSVQNPIGLPGDNLPQPDLAVFRPGDYSRRRMSAADALFVIEVADSSKRFDLDVKFPLYAAAGIPEAWLFDLHADRIQRHTDPGPDGYRQVASAGRGESLASLSLPSVVIVVDDVLGPPIDPKTEPDE